MGLEEDEQEDGEREVEVNEEPLEFNNLDFILNSSEEDGSDEKGKEEEKDSGRKIRNK